jgi:NAD(P)-dependent dehydrogenase (short-subunit alcohol dehydrogenase family)/acyl carrier protein
VSLLAPAGRFLEIGKRDIWDLPTMRQTRPDVAYWPYDLSTNLIEDPPLIPRLLREIAQRLTSGELRPLPASVFPLDEAPQAFRHMARARHIGKVVLSVPGGPVAGSNSRAGGPALRPDATYLISGGRGGIGLHLAEWLVRQGARRLALLGRSEPSASAREALARMEQAGASVVMEQVDVSESDAVAQVVDRLGRTGNLVRGVFHCAGVLDDGVLAQQSWQRFVRVMTPKVDGAWNLHQATRHLSLDWFVLFSSAASLFGAAGQGNYAAGNAFLDGLAHYRRAQGQPGLSVNWGAWAGGGMATSLGAEHRERWRQQGMGLIDPESGLEVLGRLMDGGPAQAAVLPITWRRFLETDSPLARSSLLDRLRGRQSERPVTSGSSHGAATGWAERLRAASDESRKEIVGEFLLAELSGVLQISPSSVPVDEALTQLGLDSLLAVELRNRIEKGLGISVPVVRLLQDSSVATLGVFVLEQVVGVPAAAGLVPNAAVEDDGVEEGGI